MCFELRCDTLAAMMAEFVQQDLEKFKREAAS